MLENEMEDYIFNLEKNISDKKIKEIMKNIDSNSNIDEENSLRLKELLLLLQSGKNPRNPEDYNLYSRELMFTYLNYMKREGRLDELDYRDFLCYLGNEGFLSLED